MVAGADHNTPTTRGSQLEPYADDHSHAYWSYPSLSCWNPRGRRPCVSRWLPKRPPLPLPLPRAGAGLPPPRTAGYSDVGRPSAPAMLGGIVTENFVSFLGRPESRGATPEGGTKDPTRAVNCVSTGRGGLSRSTNPWPGRSSSPYHSSAPF